MNRSTSKRKSQKGSKISIRKKSRKCMRKSMFKVAAMYISRLMITTTPKYLSMAKSIWAAESIRSIVQAVTVYKRPPTLLITGQLWVLSITGR